MRSTLLFACLFLLALTAPAQVVWQQNWGGPYDDGAEIRNTRDGGLIALASQGIHSWILRLDANGDTLWTKVITQPYDLGAITETPDGGFLAVGLTRYANRDIIAWKFGIHGDSLWMRTYVDPTSIEGLYSVYLRPDSSFLITGYTSANAYDMLAIHVDSLGNPLWRKNYGSPGFEGGTMASPTADGGYVLATTTGNSSTYIWVVRINSAGDTVWTRNVVEAWPTGGAVPMVASDGKIWVIGWINHGDFNNYLCCLDSTGTLLWSREYPGIGFESRSARGVIEDMAGGFSFACSLDDAYGPVAGHDIALFRVDSLGNVMRIHRVGGAGDEMPRYFEQAQNGDYLFIGFTSSFTPTGQQTYIARLNPNGCGEFLYDFDSTLYHKVCPGDTLTLDAGAGFVSWLWSDGDTNQVRPVLQSDTFYVQAIDSNGCPNYSNTVVVQLLSPPDFTWQQVGSLTVQFDDTIMGGNIMAWDFGDGVVDSLPDPLHVYADSGTYWVCLTVQMDTCSPFTICDSVVVTEALGLAGMETNDWWVYPNPARENVMLENRRDAAVQYCLTDVLGRKMMQGEIAANARLELNISALPAGLYYLAGYAGTDAVQALRMEILR